MTQAEIIKSFVAKNFSDNHKWLEDVIQRYEKFKAGISASAAMEKQNISSTQSNAKK